MSTGTPKNPLNPSNPLQSADSVGQAAAEKALADHRILHQFYGPVPTATRRTPMRELISTLLSHRTTHADEELAYDRMLEAYGDWEGVLHAPLDGLIHAIRTTRWPATQAPRIQDVLARIKAQTGGQFTLDFLATWPTAQAMQWLTEMPGIGLKTASLVLLFNFRKPVQIGRASCRERV